MSDCKKHTRVNRNKAEPLTHKEERLKSMADAVKKAQKPLTESEIGERVGLTRQGVSNYREQLKEHPDLKHDTVGNALCYHTLKLGRSLDDYIDLERYIEEGSDYEQ